MNPFSRRFLIALAGSCSLPSYRMAPHEHSGHQESNESATCATPAPVVPVSSDIPFDLAYIDTMIPHHASVIALAEKAIDDLEDSRLIEIAQVVLDSQPGEIELLQQFREEWYPDEPAEVSHDRMMEMMLVTMAGSMDGSTLVDEASLMDGDAMMLMDSVALVNEFNKADNKDLGFIDLVVPHHQMAVRQSQVGLQLAEHQELVAMLDDVITAQTAEIATLISLREEIEAES